MLMSSELWEKLRNVNRRKCNVIFSGLLETGTKEKDIVCITNFTRDLLNMDLRSNVITCKRIGKEVPSHARRLLLSLVSESTADELLRRAPTIRGSDNEYIANNIFINRDLTPEEKEAFLRREERRAHRDGVAGARGVGDVRDKTATIVS